ncbi:MAG: glycosyltransferase family 4 protein [Pirellulales bacterium]|nr:glycosyltransferase family 4 protein [Pirellulales bacterium]
MPHRERESNVMAERCVLMLSYPFPPASLAGVYRTLRFVKYLPENGWKPLVVAPSPEVFDPAWCDPALESAIPPGTVVARTKVYRPVLAVENFANTLRSWSEHHAAGSGETNGQAESPMAESVSPDPANPGRMKRFARDALQLIFASPDAQIGWLFPAVQAALKLIRRHRVEAIYSTAPPHSSHLIAAVLKIITRLPVVIDFRDPWSRGAWRHDRRGAIHRYLHPGLESLCVRLANGVILNTPAMREEFRSAYPAQPPAKFVAIPNGFDPDFASFSEAQPEKRERNGNDAAIVCHPGSIYGKRDLRPVVAAVEKLVRSGRRVKFEQIGSVENESAVRSYAESLGVRGDVLFHGMLPHEDTLRRMSNADVFLLSQPGAALQIPGKIFEMLPFGRPIVALTESDGATAEVINRYGLGSVVYPSDSGAIAAAIARNIEIAAEFKSTGGWRKAMAAFNGRELTKTLGQTLDACLPKGRPSNRSQGTVPIFAARKMMVP